MSQTIWSELVAHTGIFTAKCVCSRTKLLDVSVLTKTEGVSTALSIHLLRFVNLPRVCYFDNCCNMARSIVLRVPLVNNICRLLSDRYHYTGHTCNSICDPESYLSSSERTTSRAESINQLCTFSKSHLRFLSPEKLIPSLTARFVFLNVRRCTREDTEKSDITAKMYLNSFTNGGSVAVFDAYVSIRSQLWLIADWEK